MFVCWFWCWWFFELNGFGGSWILYWEGNGWRVVLNGVFYWVVEFNWWCWRFVLYWVKRWWNVGYFRCDGSGSCWLKWGSDSWWYELDGWIILW